MRRTDGRQARPGSRTPRATARTRHAGRSRAGQLSTRVLSSSRTGLLPTFLFLALAMTVHAADRDPTGPPPRQDSPALPVHASARLADPPAPSLRHARLLRSEPAADTVLTEAPTRVQLWFSEPVNAVPDAVVVVGPAGDRVDHEDAAMASDDATLLEAGMSAAASGRYTVRWAVASPDGHPIRGELAFTLELPSPPAEEPAAAAPPEEPAATPDQPSTAASGLPVLAVGRWLHVLGLALAIGPMVLLLIGQGELDSILRRRLWRTALGGTSLLVIAAAWSLVSQTAALTGSAGSLLRADVLVGVLTSPWGRLWLGRLAFTILLLALAGYSTARSLDVRSPGLAARHTAWAWLGVGLALPLLVLSSLNSHAATLQPVAASVVLDTIHLGAAVAWVGGLIALPLSILTGLRSRPIEEQSAALGLLVPRFSVLALVSVLLLVTTGLYPAWILSGGPAALRETPYGGTLLIKLLLILLIMGPVAINRFVLKPRLAAASSTADAGAAGHVRRFRRMIALEAAISTLILAAAALLASLPPARDL